MNSRFVTNITLAIAGGFLVATSFAFGVSTFMWLMFGIGILGVALAGTGALPGRGAQQRGLDGIIGILGAWTIVASLVFSGSAVMWLGFASGCALVALALAGLTLHELKTERVVHSFELRTPTAERELAGMH
jgi:hypothetical protein